MKKEMLINVLQPEECRIAIVENGVLEELYVERTSHESYTGNIYKGKVVNLEPAIQAAFVDFSVGRNGFLHVSDVEPQYYTRHQPPGDEIEPTSRQGPPSGPRTREPRRGRERDDRRRPRPEPSNEAFPPSLPAPPRADDRSRDRDRPDRDRPDRERPDRSVRGRRDRSEMPRRFGEGLGDERDNDQPVDPIGPEPSTFEPPAPPLDEPLHNLPEDESSPWTEAVGRDWEPERDRERERERDRDLDREREFREIEPEEPRWRPGKPAESFDPDLPPSRTQRTKFSQPPPTPHDDEPEERSRYRPGPGPGAPEAYEPEEVREDAFGEGLAADPFAAREPRRGRGRGRPPAPPTSLPSSRPLPGFEEEELEHPESEGGSERRSPSAHDDYVPIEEERPVPEPPRRRGGRAAIRSRGGERGAETGRPREPLPPPSPGPERFAAGAAGADIERFRPADLEPPVQPERGRGAEPKDAPRERERTRPHNRAGEPGYVPRRERLRSVDQGPGEEPPSATYGWPARPADVEADIESREFLAADEEPLGRPRPAGSAADAREGKRRRQKARQTT